MAQTKYDRQDRGGAGAYDRYLRGMNASMRQKIALTAAHLPANGRVADMGMGSAAGSEALAALYPAMQVIGVDINPEMVERARRTYQRPNLSFETGDIAETVFAPESLDGILNSSVLHHVTSFSGYDHGAAARALSKQTAQLKEGGLLIVRDFLDPGPGEVLLDLPEDDGEGATILNCSSARLLLIFAARFRALHRQPGFPVTSQPGAPTGWQRFRIERRLAVEFVLRKAYRADWETEILEEYTYFTQATFEKTFASLGLRVLASTPIWNPWIVTNRYEGQFVMRALDGTRLPWPATNYVIVGEKTQTGTHFRSDPSPEAPSFLRMEAYRHRGTGQIYDLGSRPSATLDLLPYFESEGELFVLARMSYPRPILGHAAPLDGTRAPQYVTEPITLIERDQPLGTTLEAALLERAGISGEDIRRVVPAGVSYPSPGGTLEQVRSVQIEIAPRFVEASLTHDSGFGSPGRVGAIEARQLLRAAQVGGLPDARLEQGVHALLVRLGRRAGPWIGGALDLKVLDTIEPSPWPRGASGLRRAFEPAPAPVGFLRTERLHYTELDAAGVPIASRPLEHVAPVSTTAATVVSAVLAMVEGAPCIAVEDADLPAAQCFTGHSELLVAPAWRVPVEVEPGLAAARGWVVERLAAEHGIQAGRTWLLGGLYFPSAGLSPEVVHPIAVQATAVVPSGRPLLWIPLAQIARDPTRIRDGHLRIVAMRAAHALGLLEGP